MNRIHYVESDTTHDGEFFLDVPLGHHWLLVVTKSLAQFWVDGELKEYPAHSAVLYRPQQKVYYRASADVYINDWIRFESDETYVTESPLPLGVPFALSDPRYVHKLFELLVMEHNFQRDYHASSIDCLLRTLFNKLLESYFQKDMTPQYYHLLQLRAAIHNNPGDEWTVPRMAEMVRISPGYLQSIYKRAFGITCMDDVIGGRIRIAKQLLIQSGYSIAEISSRCGYRNVEHFCRQFKQITGSTPGNFQKHADR